MDKFFVIWYTNLKEIKNKGVLYMDGIACMLNKKCRREKSEEIVKNLNAEQDSYEKIYGREEKKN